jgi:hypothetical protein
MNTLNYVFYGSIIALVLLQAMMTSLKVQEPFVIITKNLQGKENDTANLKCGSNEKIIDVDLLKYGTQLYVDGKINIGGISNIDLKNKTACVNKESCSFTVNNKLAGKDPAGGARKVWKIAYKCEKPDAPKPVQPTPINTQPVTTQPVQQPVTTQPVQQPVQQPVITQPVQQPVITQPVQQPVTTQPVQQPVTTQPVQQPVTTQPVQQPIVSLLPSFMNQSRLLLPFNDIELQEYKLFHIIIISCVIKDTLNVKMKNKQISFKQLYRENLQKMGIEPRIFERNLDAYMAAIQKQSDFTWKEVFESNLFLNAITENIQYYLTNPSQSKLNDKQQPIGTFENIRKPILNESIFVSAYNKCRTRMKSLEVYSPISYSTRLYD